MPIISSQIIKFRDRGEKVDLRMVVWLQHIDHNGDKHNQRYYHNDVNHDKQAKIDELVVKLESGLISREKESFQEEIQNGGDPAQIACKHLSNEQKAKRVIKALMLSSSYNAIKAAGYVQNFTNAQIENHFTQEQRVRIRAMQNHVLDNQSLFTTDLREGL